MIYITFYAIISFWIEFNLILRAFIVYNSLDSSVDASFQFMGPKFLYANYNWVNSNLVQKITKSD